MSENEVVHEDIVEVYFLLRGLKDAYAKTNNVDFVNDIQKIIDAFVKLTSSVDCLDKENKELKNRLKCINWAFVGVR